MRCLLVTLLLLVPLVAQTGRADARSQPSWAKDLAAAQAEYERGMAELRAGLDVAIGDHVTRLERQGHDRQAAQLERDAKRMLSSGELPSGLPAGAIPLELQQKERGLRGQLFDAYRTAADACRKLLDVDLARALEFEAKQRTTENDRNELRGVEFFAAVAKGRGAVVEAAARRSSIFAMLEQRLTAIGATPTPLQVRAPGLEYEFEITAKHDSGRGPLCATLSRKGEVPQTFETWQSKVGDSVILRVRVRQEGASVDLAHAVVSTRKLASAPAASLLLWSPEGKFTVVAVRSKPIRAADAIQGPAQVAGTATAARPAAAAKAGDEFPLNRTWTARWQESECSVSVIARGDNTMTLRVMRGDGSIWDFHCTTQVKKFRIRTIVQIKNEPRRARPLISDETGAGHVHGEQINFNFKAMADYPRKLESIEGPIQGRR